MGEKKGNLKGKGRDGRDLDAEEKKWRAGGRAGETRVALGVGAGALAGPCCRAVHYEHLTEENCRVQTACILPMTMGNGFFCAGCSGERVRIDAGLWCCFRWETRCCPAFPHI